MINLIFNKKTFLEILKKFVFFINTNEGLSEKIIASYHQFYGVLDAYSSIVKGINSNILKDKKAGIFWHTQGSGKSFSMLMLTKNIIETIRKVTILVVTDRNNLDEQIYNIFQNAKEYLGQNIKHIETIQDLEKNLKDKKQNDIFFTTVQKFQKKVGLLSERKDILIICDEAHRSQKDILYPNLKINKSNKELLYQFSYAYNLRKAFPNATYIGFTATPIIGTNNIHITRDVFGDYVSKYPLKRAQRDGVIVPINYECRQLKLHLKIEKYPLLDKEYEEIIANIKRKSQFNQGILIKNFNKQIQQIENIIGDNDRIDKIAKDFIQHYKKRKNLLHDKAIFVAYNRNIAFKYYQKICQLDSKEFIPNKTIRIVVSGEYQQTSTKWPITNEKKEQTKAANEFKDPNSNLKVVIVVDMWLTGFDVPCLDILYIDKYMKKHTLMQAICRVNRVYNSQDKNRKKEGGIVVDYIGISSKLTEAFKIYSGFDEKDEYDGEYKPSLIDSGENIEDLKIKILKIKNFIYKSILNNFKVNLEKFRTDL